jgi:hypothetical protein
MDSLEAQVTDTSTTSEWHFNKPLYERWAGICADLVNRRKRTERRWNKYFKDYRGEQTISGDDDEIIVNMSFCNTQIIKSVLYYQDPYFRVRPRRDPNIAPKAQLLEELLNTTWYKLRAGREVKKAIVDAAICGWGCCLVGYSNYHNPSLVKMGDGQVYLKRMNPMDIYPEDDVEEFGDATYWIRRGTYSIRWLEKAFNMKWQAGVESSVFSRRSLMPRYTNQATVFEIVDLVENMLYILSPQHKKIIYKTEYPYPYFNGTMYQVLQLAEDPERLYPISMLKVVEGQQDELNRIRTQQMRHRKRFNRRYLMAEGTIDEAELEKIVAGADGTIAKCKGDPGACIRPIEDAPLDQGMTVLYQQDIKGDMREILGINEYMRAGLIPRTKSATESNMIQSGSDIRTRDLALPVQYFIEDIAKRMILLFQNEYTDINYLLRSSGQTAEAIRWSKEDIAGDYEVEVELGSLLPPQPLPYEMLSQGASGGGQQPTQELAQSGPAPQGQPEGMGI